MSEWQRRAEIQLAYPYEAKRLKKMGTALDKFNPNSTGTAVAQYLTPAER